jgi:hypothetical protein
MIYAGKHRGTGFHSVLIKSKNPTAKGKGGGVPVIGREINATRRN